MHGCLLVVDDEPDVLDSLRSLLESCGHEVCTAVSAEEAFRMFLTEQPKVALVDFKLPGASGVKFLEWVRACHSDLQVILITGFPSDWDLLEHRGRNLHAFACLRKPVPTETLLQVIEEAEGRA
ncbi:MAG: response regulator [Candidatus Omnitrophica bacterium]|nr:response regulator [Candidatus Omnitrophota bacterium]